MKTLKIFFTLAIITFSTKAQDLAINTSNNYYAYEEVINTPEPLLESTSYTYKYKGNNVLVIFSENQHIEYFNNKKHFIKSNLVWTADNECYMTIQESNLPDFPFRNGTKLHMKITKIKRGYIHYESTLGGRTWTGKMKKM